MTKEQRPGKKKVPAGGADPAADMLRGLRRVSQLARNPPGVLRDGIEGSSSAAIGREAENPGKHLAAAF